MNTAAFDGTARFIWSRHRKLLLIFAAIYLTLFLCSQTLSAEVMRPYLPPAFSFLRLASFFLPLILFTSTVNAATLDLGARPGQFPRIFFTLPMKAHEMVLPFISYAVGAAALLWLAGALISRQRILMFGAPGTPIEAETIAYWIPCLATSLLVWLQAVIWTPFRHRWQRASAMFAIILAHCALAVLYVVFSMTQTEVIAACVLQIPLAFLVATRGVARERSGGVPDKARAVTVAKPTAPRAFSSPMNAQMWFEARVHRWHGVAVFAPPALLLLVFIGADLTGVETRHPTVYTAISRLIVMMSSWLLIAAAAILGMSYASYRRQGQWQLKNPYAMPPFFAALPIATGDFVWAKITTASIRLLWLNITALIVCGWVAARSGMLDIFNEPVLVLIIPVTAFVLFLISATANVMCLFLAGRAWNWINAVHFARYLFIALAGAAVGRYWGVHHEPPPGLGETIRVLAVMKLAALALIVYHVGTRSLWSWNRIATLGVFWAATLASIITVALFALPAGRASLTTVVSFLILATPVLSTATAPLALQLNRTR